MVVFGYLCRVFAPRETRGDQRRRDRKKQEDETEKLNQCASMRRKKRRREREINSTATFSVIMSSCCRDESVSHVMHELFRDPMMR